jgi:O-antigen ligase
MLRAIITPRVALWPLLASQVFIMIIYLGTKKNEFEESLFSNFIYLNAVKYATLILVLLFGFLLYSYRKQFQKVNKLLLLAFLLPTFILYASMIWHTDIKAINSPTFIIMILIPLFLVYIGINSQVFSLKIIGTFSIAITVLNFGIVMLQVYELIPVAQGNIRSTLALTGNRPTGLFFNAFALGYAAIVTYAINIYLAKNLNGIKIKALYIFGTVLSALVIVLSGTRTPLLVVAIITILVIIEKNKLVQNNSKLVSGLVASIVVLFPFLIILLGRYIDHSNYATLNGRTLLWDCVTSRWQELFPFGMGVQGAFYPGFCSDEPWFSKLRHPENMFLMNFVESGVVGVIGLLFMFLVTFWISQKSLKNGNSLPLAVSATFLMSSMLYVPLFHYLPFLANRPADRGIFNFFLITALWLIVLIQSENLNKELKIDKDEKDNPKGHKSYNF